MMTRAALLEASYDRAIPEGALRLARALDAAEAPVFAKLPAKPRPRSANRCIVLLARLMVEREAATGACSEEDLLAAGFSLAELRRHAGAARALAQRSTADRQRASLPVRGAKHSLGGASPAVETLALAARADGWELRIGAAERVKLPTRIARAMAQQILRGDRS